MKDFARAATTALLFCVGIWTSAGTTAGNTVKAAVETVDARMDTAYLEQLHRYDAELAAAPDDPDLAVGRCEFIRAFTDASTGRYVVGAEDAFSDCLEGIAATLPNMPAVRVYLVETGYIEDVEEIADVLFAESAGWSDDLRRRLATELYWVLHDEREGVMATVAAQLGNPYLVGRAVTHLVEGGDHRAARELLERALPTDNDTVATRRVEAALLVEPEHVALSELRRQEKAERQVDTAVATQAFLRAGDTHGARQWLDALDAADDEDAMDLARFDVAHAAGDWADAAAAISLVRTEGFVAHLERFAKLVVASPATLLRPALWPSLAVLLGVLLALALAPALVLLPVHYRGALRRLSGRAPVPIFEPFGLRHAWIALAALLIVPMLVLGVLAPHDLANMLAEELPAGRTLMLTGLWGSLACLAVFALPLMRFGTAGGFGWARLHRAWWRILLAWAALLAIGSLLAAWHQLQGGDTETGQVRMVADLVNSGQTAWEALLALTVVALLGPLWEEVAFRGLLLGGMARHISFGWANLIQATTFALIHDDPPRFLFYLALGLLAGWLVRSTRSLAPALMLHMLNNALAFLLIMRSAGAAAT
ncbi:CPBP family intramembrane glutamic endopeptidase [Luteimonas sp. MJ293]|uniref:CPBP family intramembrane glutamic endopeptidase n=1 Tax=Luteimonas sp. MJ146 TaxID=3129240 RepID=UPI0031BBB107